MAIGLTLHIRAYRVKIKTSGRKNEISCNLSVFTYFYFAIKTSRNCRLTADWRAGLVILAPVRSVT